MALKPYDVLVPGHYFCDVVFTGLPAFPAPGTEIYCDDVNVVPGGVLNTVVAFKRLGVKVGWLGALGEDFFSRFIQEWAEQEGLDLSLVTQQARPLRRLTVSLSLSNDRAFVTYADTPPGVIELTRQHLADTRCRHLHFSGLVVDERMPALLRECRACGIEVSMDCQHREQTLAQPLVREIISLLDLFLPNAVEAQRLTGTNSSDEAAALLAEFVPLLVIKEGAQGARCWWQGRCYHAPALPGDPVDTTGAGDVFNAAFIAAHLDGADPEVCLRQGTVAGSLSTQGIGGCSNAPDCVALQAALARHAGLFS